MNPNDENPQEVSKFAWITCGFIVGVIVVGIIALLLLGPILGGIAMGEGMSDMHVIDYALNPDGSTVAYAISDDCGATCGCATRVDIQYEGLYYREVFRSNEACELFIEWINQIELEVSFPDYYDLSSETININSIEE